MKRPEAGMAAFLQSYATALLLVLRVFLCFKSCHRFFCLFGWLGSFGISTMEFWRLCLKFFQDLTWILPPSLCWDSIEYFNKAGSSSKFLFLLDIPGFRCINSCFGEILTLGLWYHTHNHTDIQNILAHEKCLSTFYSDSGERVI